MSDELSDQRAQELPRIRSRRVGIPKDHTRRVKMRLLATVRTGMKH